MNDTYFSISETSEGEYKEKGSKFISFAYPVNNLEEIQQILTTFKTKYYDARHICYAYRLGFLGDQYRFNDDGEPSGSAGKPIYGQLLSFNVTNILIIVVRYFGGVKLGVGGLTSAYRSSARDALDAADIKEFVIYQKFRLNFDYPLMNDVMRLIKEEDYSIINQVFELSCSMQIKVRISDIERAEMLMSNLYGLTFTKLD